MKKGFTLIELLVVIAIIGVLATVVLGSLNAARSRSRDAKRQLDIHSINNALTMYYDDHQAYPSSLGSDWLSSNTTNWGSLATSLNQYIKTLPVDPTNSSSLVYKYNSDVLGSTYSLTYQSENKLPATWDPANKGPQVSLGNGNLTATSTDTVWYEAVRANVGVSSGKVYWELTNVQVAGVIGIMGPSANLSSWVGADAYGWGLYTSGGTLYGTGKNPAWVTTTVPWNSTVGFGLDMDAGTLRIWVNGVDGGIAFTGLTGTIYPASTILPQGVTANFGATPFAYPQAGYTAGVFQH